MSNAKAQSDVIDIQVENQGSLFTFEALTDEANEWMEQHIPEDATWFGARLIVEHRYARDLANGMIGDGLCVR
jgi:hypothetical protein